MLIQEALKKIFENINLKNSSEFISIDNAVNKIVAEDIVAVKNLPSFDNSALDGYAINFADRKAPISITDTVFAGDGREISIKSGECVKIMTGAKMPKGADTVVRFEDAIIESGKLIVDDRTKQFSAFRHKGEEIKSGDVLFGKGTRLSAAHVMMLAAQGISFVRVFCEPKIGIFSSGDEIVEPWQSASEDQIYNANAIGMQALLSKFGFKSSYLGIIKDDLNDTINAINSADMDVLICSGGASKGEADFMKTALLSLGFTELFSHIDARPARPSKAYVKDSKIVFIMPGNPMSAFLSAFLLIVPFLLKRPLEATKAYIMQDLKVKSGRENVVLGRLEEDKFYVTDDNKYGSGMIMPLVKSNAICLSNFNQSEFRQNDEVLVYKFS
ncbi:molybdopterin molybdotransferase MoeA [Campylobacter sp. RM15925]|uniref:molybdopterin molybdotransferase MoeA n=1 Tax=Campylobacter sp. RM15925 TaxID=1705724 RepID=UPI00147397A4|nr:molybdopterin molybdotransferase MoeA [Campylobacter sp. RM15925]